MTMSQCFTIQNNLSEVRSLVAAISDLCRRHSLLQKDIEDISLTLEEVCVNIISYAYNDHDSHEIKVHFQLNSKGLTIRVEDDGKPFNPLMVPTPDLNKPVDQQQEGGLGIYLMRKLMDGVDYQRAEGHNVLSFHKRVGDEHG